MDILKDFPGGNIEILEISGDTITLEPETGNDNGYFYWAFCVRNAQNKNITFKFPSDTRVGMFGAAVSHDLKQWTWSKTKFEENGNDGFTYHFSEDEDCVYFAHDMVYSHEMLNDFLAENNIKSSVFCKSRKGRDVPCFTIGDGEKIVLFTSRHHACESTGTHVLQGIAKECIKNPVPGIKFLFVPFVDYDGVMDGDAGKGRLPYDHNRDYCEKSAIYPETAKLREIAESGNVLMNFDFHSPHHSGWINDYPYLMKCENTENGIQAKLSGLLKEFTENDENSMRYSGNEDINYGDEWNEKGTPNIKNFFRKRTITNFSSTLEMPYFGLENNRFEQKKAIKFGEYFYKAIKEIIKETRQIYEKI